MSGSGEARELAGQPGGQHRPAGTGRMIGLVGAALVVAAGVIAALANFVPWPVAAGLGALSGAAGWYGGLRLQHRAERRTREAAWAAAVSAGPAAGDGTGDGVLALLLPEQQLAPHSVLHQSLRRELVRWASGAGRIAEPVMYVDGPPGCGKTRLLVELAEQASARCGWVLAGRGAAAVAAAAGLDCPVLLLVDDADTRGDVAALLTARRDTATALVRVVLVTRTSPWWWQTLRASLPAHVVAGLPYRAQVSVPPIVGDAHNQRQTFAQALRYFTPEGEAVPGASIQPRQPPPSILLVHAAAALAATTNQDGTVDLDTVVADLFTLEHDRWRSTLDTAGLAGVPVAVLDQALVLAALVGAADEPAALRLLACLPALAEPAAAQLRRRIADWLRGWYPQQFADWLAPHLPAVVLEQHAARAVAEDRALAPALAAAVADDEDRAGRLVMVFGRALAHSPRAGAALAALIGADLYRMTRVAIIATAATGLALDQIVAASLTHSGTALAADQLRELYQLIPAQAKTHLLAGTTVTMLWAYLSHHTTDPTHPDALTTRHGLAGVLADQGHYPQAAEQYQTVLTIRTDTLGAEHPDTLRTRHNLAGVLADQGHYPQAAEQYQTVLTIQTATLGAEHPDTLRTRHNLALVLAHQGHYPQAAEQYQTVLTIQTDTLGAEHPDTLRTRHNLALVLDHQGHPRRPPSSTRRY